MTCLPATIRHIGRNIGTIRRMACNKTTAPPAPGTRFGLLTFVSVSENRHPVSRAILWRCVCDCGAAGEYPHLPLRAGKRLSCGCARRADDLTGHRFGRLFVLSRADSLGGHHRWSCACDCGSTCVVRGHGLQSGDARSCGCLKSDLTSERSAANLAGQRFGRLTALSRVDHRSGRPRWLCACDCGGSRVALASTLKAGHAISCGCAKRDLPGLMPASVRDERAAIGNRRRARRRSAPGSFTAAQIDALYLAQRGRCACCRVKLNGVFHRDHRVALANGGTNDIGNIELLCGPCNLSKGAKDEIAWAAENGRLL